MWISPFTWTTLSFSKRRLLQGLKWTDLWRGPLAYSCKYGYDTCDSIQGRECFLHE